MKQLKWKCFITLQKNNFILNRKPSLSHSAKARFNPEWQAVMVADDRLWCTLILLLQSSENYCWKDAILLRWLKTEVLPAFCSILRETAELQNICLKLHLFHSTRTVRKQFQNNCYRKIISGKINKFRIKKK